MSNCQQFRLGVIAVNKSRRRLIMKVRMVCIYGPWRTSQDFPREYFFYLEVHMREGIQVKNTSHAA